MIHVSPTRNVSDLLERMCEGRVLQGVQSRTAIQGVGNLTSTCLPWLLPVDSRCPLPASLSSHGSYRVPSTALGGEKECCIRQTHPSSQWISV